MIRPVSYALLGILAMVSPLRLAAQNADAHAALVTMGAGIPSEAGCDAGVADEQSGHGFDLSNLDRTISPCDDFFQFADGGWVKSHPIPAAYPTWGTFNKLRQDNETALSKILEKAAADKNATAGSNWRKIGDFYASCMDETAVETAGLKPLLPQLQRIADIHDAQSLQAEIARLQRDGAGVLFAFGSEQDYKNSTQVIASARQGGLGMPDRDYYTKDDEKSEKLRAAYLQHVTNMFKLAGDDDATP